MPDLDIVMMQQCKSLSVTSAKVGEYFLTGIGLERLWPACTCSAYKFCKHGTTHFGRQKVPNWCKHIHQYHDNLCAWHEQDGTHAQTDEQRKNMLCPKCGGETEWVRVAV